MRNKPTITGSTVGKLPVKKQLSVSSVNTVILHPTTLNAEPLKGSGSGFKDSGFEGVRESGI